MVINLNEVIKDFNDEAIKIPNPQNSKELIEMTKRDVINYALDSYPNVSEDKKDNFHFYNIKSAVAKKRYEYNLDDPEEKAFLVKAVNESKILARSVKALFLKQDLNNF